MGKIPTHPFPDKSGDGNNVKNQFLVVSIFIFSGLIISPAVMAEGNSVPHSDGVGTGATRVVYPSGSKHVTLSVNNTADHPFLVESVVLDESMQQEAPFIITPPLFRLDGGQRNTLRIMRTGGHFPADRESINWICVKPIPPEPDSTRDEGEKDSVGRDNLSVTTRLLSGICIKLFFRPEIVHGNSLDMADKVTWTIKGKTVTASNPTHFYMNISWASINGKKLKMDKTYIPPFSEEKYPLPEGVVKNNAISWSVVGDYGEEKKILSILN